MAEKLAVKKERKNTKKPNKNREAEKKPKDKKKEKSSKENSKQKKHGNKTKGNFIASLLQAIVISVICVTTVLGFLYIVDFDKYRSVRDRGLTMLNSTVNLLPPEVVSKGHEAIEFIRPTLLVAVDKVRVLVNQTTTVLNTNPALKDHWTNINEISSVIGERLAEYMRTVYKHIPIYYDNAKNKLF